MQIKLKKMVLENYKCFPRKEVEFSHRTQITGRNRAGKSTIENCYLEVMTNKQLDGSQPDGVRPHDENGVDLNRSDVIRELHLEIDGKTTVIRKRTFQKWRKPHGQTEEVFDGNGEDFEVDGFPYKPAKFKEYMAGIADPDVLLMCSNANVFLATLKKSTADARKILEKMARFSLEQFIAEHPEYVEVAEITKGHSVEDAFKKLRKDQTSQKKKIEAQNEKIKHEQSRPLASADIEISDLELVKGEWKDKLAEADKQERELEDSAKDFNKLSDELWKLKSDAKAIENAAAEETWNKKAAFRKEISEIGHKKSDLELSLTKKKHEAELLEKTIQSIESEIQTCRDQYSEEASREFDETRLREIEVEQFDENSYICPTCGQELPADKKEKLLSDFEKRKKSRIAAEELSRKNFLIEQDSKLNELAKRGNKIAEDLKAAKQELPKLQSEIAELSEKVTAVTSDIEQLNAELNKIPDAPDLSDNEEYQNLCAKISEAESRLAELPNGAEKRLEIRQKRNQYMTEIANIDGKIQSAAREQENKERILADLQTELRQMAQVQADIEKQIDVLSKFSRAKNESLAQEINPKMDGFEFKFLAYTIEGNPYETLEIWRNGVEFQNLNYSDRLIVQANMLRGFQRMNNIDLPIWIDNIESVNADRIPNLDTQMIVLRVSDGDLAVCEC